MVKMKEGPWAGKEVRMAPNEGVLAEAPAIDALLDLMGIEALFVTDWSQLDEFGLTDEELNECLPVPLDSRLTLLEALAEIRRSIPGWPARQAPH